MLKQFFCICTIFFLLLLWTPKVGAQEPQINDTYQKATVTDILSEQKITKDDQVFYLQELEVSVANTSTSLPLTLGSEFQPITENQRLTVGDVVIVSQQKITENESTTVFNDRYRLPVLIALFFGFAALVVLVGGKKGAFSIIGMLFSLYVLVTFILPHILAGENPFFITLVGAVLTAVVTMYMSHGFKRQTHLALTSMLVCLFAVAILSTTAVSTGAFLGLGSEEASFLQFGEGQKINLQGLFLAGILLGTLGILDDITLAQTSVIEQLKAVNPKMTFSELYSRGLAVGRDHVASLVNTLVFAYAGTSLPLFLLFTLYRTQPLWVIINSEIIAEEIIRTVVGSIALVLAVPITTAISAYWVTYKNVTTKPRAEHHH